jgi:hypothetical protein
VAEEEGGVAVAVAEGEGEEEDAASFPSGRDMAGLFPELARSLCACVHRGSARQQASTATTHSPCSPAWVAVAVGEGEGEGAVAVGEVAVAVGEVAVAVAVAVS